MMAAESIFVDTNVLLSASAPGRGLHGNALFVLQDWPRQGRRLYCNGQVLREYLVVSTRPLAQNGLGLTIEDALHNLRAFSGRLKVLAESEAVSLRLRQLVGFIPCLGKQIHDANLVATALVHKVNGLVTENIEDFRRFEGTLVIIDLASLGRKSP